MHNKLILKILLCLTFTIIIKADCPLSYYPRQSTIGYIRVNIDQNIDKSKPQIYTYPLVQQLKSRQFSRTVIGINGFSVQKKSKQFGFEIQSSLPQGPITYVIFNVNVIIGDNNDRWKHIVINFIVSQNTQLQVGTKTLYQLIPTSNPNLYTVQQKLTIPHTGFNYKTKIKIFISGIHLQQKINLQDKQKIQQNINRIQTLRNFSWNTALINRFVKILSDSLIPTFTIQQPNISSNGLLNFQISISQVQIRTFTYSFLVYWEKTNLDVQYQTVMSSFVLDDQDTHFYDKLEHDQMKIIGINGIKYSNQWEGKISLDIRTGQINGRNFFAGAIQGLSAQFNIQYFSISTLPGAVCQTCPGSPIAYQQFCVSQCPSGFITSINNDGSFYCYRCQIQNFLIASQDRSICKCAIGYQLISPMQICVPCPIDCLTCIGSKCLTCDTVPPTTFRTLNNNTDRCECSTIDGRGSYDQSHRQNRRCMICHRTCLTCSGQSVTQCITCPSRRIFINGACKCLQNWVQDPQGQCVCISPYRLTNSNQCILTGSRCSQNQTLIMRLHNQRSCSCKQGFIRSIVSNRCIKQCKSYQQLNYSTQKCQCKSDLIRNQTSQLCYSCQSQLNQIYNRLSNKCECIPGFEMNRLGRCIGCPPKSYFNQLTETCDCVFNYYRKLINGPCIKCQNNWDSYQCQSIKVIRQGLQL